MSWSELWGLLAVNARINGEASAREDEEAGADGM